MDGMSDLYDSDVVEWSERQADLLRRVAAGEAVNEKPDWLNIAEEIDALGKNQGRELVSRIAVILVHLIKIQASPAVEPRAGWRETVRQQRDEIERLLADAPSLRVRIPGIVAGETVRARSRAAASLADNGEAPLIIIDEATFSADQVLGDWLP
jgi:hypothetical protein